MRKLLVVLVIGPALAAGACLVASCSATKEAAPTAVTAKAEKGTLRVSVASTGRVISNLDVDIKCKASGEVVRVPFDVSDAVKKGDLLVELDPVDEDRVEKQAGVSLSAAQARLVIAKRNLDLANQTLVTDRKRADAGVKAAEAEAKNAHAQADRQEALSRTKAGMAADRDAAIAMAAKADADVDVARVRLEELKTQELAIDLKKQEIALAEAAVESDNIALTIARDRVVDTKVYAPIDGVVAARNVETGQIITSGISSLTGGTTVFTLSDLSRIFVIAAVDESDIGSVRVGQPATVTADAFPGVSFEGKVIRIATRGVNVSNVVTFEVKIEVLSETKSLLKPEMTANVEITTAQKADVLMVPSEAVSRKGGKATVHVLKADGAAELREVTTGLTDGVQIEVATGLSEGETVVFAKAAPESRWNPGVRPIYIPGGPSPRGRR